MFYFDTSFIIPLLLPEEASDRIERFFHRVPAGARLVVSQWTKVELVSVLARLVRMGELSEDLAMACGERFKTLLSESFEVILPGSADYDLCWDFLARFDNTLRAGDALHLAIAANLAVEAIFTLDKGMLREGKVLGLPVEDGNI